MCLKWACEQDWDRIKGYAKEHGPEVLLGVYIDVYIGGRTLTDKDSKSLFSVLSIASLRDNVEMVKLILEAGFDNKEGMYMAADISMRNSDNSTILRLLLEHGLDPNVDPRLEGFVKGFYNLLMLAAEWGRIDQAIALLDHGANVNKTVVGYGGHVVSPLAFTVTYGAKAHDIVRLFLTRGAIPTTNDVHYVFGHCLRACKGEKPRTLGPRTCRDVAIKMFVTFLHLGKPDSDVVQEKFNSCHPSIHDPTITNITKHYLQGHPFCCFVCEALTAKERDNKLHMCPCRTVAYCSRSCQLKHWREHKVQCTGPLNERGESEAMVKGRHKTGKGAAKGKKGKKK
jgi:hypothetical protein